MIKQIRVLDETQSHLFLLQDELWKKYNKFYSMDKTINFLLDYYKKESTIINEALNGIYQLEELPKERYH